MGILKLNNYELPDFGLSSPFNSDIWNVQSWDFYKNAPEEHQRYWKLRSGKTNYNLDFSVCNKPIIKEELKYCMYKVFQTNINLRTFAEKYDYIKHYFTFFNARNYESITDVDISEFEIFLKDEIGLKTEIKNGSRVYTSTSEILPVKKKNRPITFLTSCIKFIDDFFIDNSGTDVYSRDIWRAHDLVILDSFIDSNRRMDFSYIPNEEFKQQLKDFCKNRLTVINFSTTQMFQRQVSVFMCWLDDNYPEIKHLNELDRATIEDYFIWLRTESDMSQHMINDNIMKLKKFFEIGYLLEFDNFPMYDLIISSDYAIKSKKEAHFFTDSELKSIIKVIPKMPKLYGKMLYVLITLGCRISELIYLRSCQLKKYPDGKYFLLLHQFKTKSDYEKSIPDSTAKIILTQIKRNKEKFGDNADYVFVNDNNKPITFGTLSKNITKVLIENNVLDRNGQPLHCNTHRFRATLATNLLKSGYDVESVGKLLGQKCIKSLSYYASVTNEEAKEQLKARIDKDELLISNIGQIDDNVLSICSNPIPLCNGWCVKNPSLGQCEKANHCLECEMFVPTFAYLNHYEMQLHEVEASISVAKANNMDVLLQKNLKTKESLEKIISKIRERRNLNE